MGPAELSLNFRSEDIIPKERANRSRWAAFLLSLLFIFLFSLYMLLPGVKTQGFKQIIYVVVLHILTKGIDCLVKGVCDFAEEIFHVKTRYSGQYKKAMGACVKKISLVLLLVGFLSKIIGSEEEFELPLFIHICLVCICDLLYIALGCQTLTQVDISSICDKKHLNVAQGLAWSYYIGYLKIILPRFQEAVRLFNNETENILRREDTCKLHILIPLSCTLYNDLNSADSNIQHFRNLPSLSIDRAGIRGRHFENSVYRICDEDGRPHYCIVEYATPLSSLYEMSNIASTAFSREDRIQQAKLFYRTLEYILETALDSDYRHLYRLIPYDDSQENDLEERNSHFLSNLILKHLQQQQAAEYYVRERNTDN